jgi:acetyl esterase/lipase
MFHNLSLLLALAASPNAVTLEPTLAGAGTNVDQTASRGVSVPRSIVQTGSGTTTGGTGMPTYGATPTGSGFNVTHGTAQAGSHMVNYFTVTIDPGSGFSESFIIFAPTAPSTLPRPLLVAFHGFGFTQKDIIFNTSFVSQCAERGWYMMAPLSASGGHFMSDPGMINTEAALAWTFSKFNIDKTRIYAAGFSMGGGMALNYAARHLDPMRGMFAAIVNHSGAVDLNDTYATDPASQFVFDFWYGNGTPNTANADKMTRSSVIQYDEVAGHVNPNTDLIRNLSHVPLQMLRASNDPLTGLIKQCDRLDEHLLSLGRIPGPSYSYQVINGFEHSWDTLNEQAACDWLSQFSLTMPDNGRTLASSESFYFHFFVNQTDTTKLTPFTWSVDTISNQLNISETANLTSLAVITGWAGLHTNQQLTVVLQSGDGLDNNVTLNGYPVKPSAVLRDGMVLPATHWGYSAAGGTVSLTEYDGANAHTWVIQP